MKRCLQVYLAALMFVGVPAWADDVIRWDQIDPELRAWAQQESEIVPLPRNLPDDLFSLDETYLNTGQIRQRLWDWRRARLDDERQAAGLLRARDISYERIPGFLSQAQRWERCAAIVDAWLTRDATFNHLRTRTNDGQFISSFDRGRDEIEGVAELADGEYSLDLYCEVGELGHVYVFRIEDRGTIVHSGLGSPYPYRQQWEALLMRLSYYDANNRRTFSND